MNWIFSKVHKSCIDMARQAVMHDFLLLKIPEMEWKQKGNLRENEVSSQEIFGNFYGFFKHFKTDLNDRYITLLITANMYLLL